MPKIPQVESRPFSLGRPASAEDFGGGVGTATARAGSAITQLGEVAGAFADAQQRSNVSLEVANSSAELERMRAELDERLARVSEEDDPFQAIEDLRTEYRTRAGEVLEKSRSKIRGAQYQQLFAERTIGISSRFGLQVNEAARGRSLERIRGQTVASTSKLADLIATTDDDEQRANYLRDIQQTLANAVASGAYTEEQAAREAARADDLIRASEVRASSQRAADEIVDSTESAAERLKLARERYTGDKRDAVVARIKDRNAEDVAAKRLADEARFTSAVTRASAGQLNHEAARELGLSGSELITVENVIDAIATRGKVSTDWGTYFELRAQATNPSTRDAFRAADLNAYADKLGPQQMKELLDLQTKDDSEAIDGFSQKVDDAMARLELPITPVGIAKASEEKKQRGMLFRRRIDAERIRREKALGRVLTGPEQDELIDYASAEVVEDVDFFRNDTAPRFGVIPEEIGDVPEDQARVIRERMRQRGEDPRDEGRVRFWYLRALGVIDQ